MVGTMEPTLTKKQHYSWSVWMLCAVNAGSLALAASLVLVLNPEDRISVVRGCALTALGAVYFTSLFEVLNVVALYSGSAGARAARAALSPAHLLDVNNKLVSGVQALWCALAGAAVCAHSCRKDFLRASHYMSDAYAWFGAAYFFYDIWSMYMVHVQMFGATSFWAYCRHEPVILLHHLFIGGFGFLVIVYLRGSLGDCTFGFVYLMEVSTPCVSARGVLSRLRLKDHPAYLLNGLAMLAAFLIFRVLSLPFVAYLYSRHVQLPYLQALQSLPTGCKISIAILLLPQLYWFYLMSAGALKLFLKGGGKEKGAVVAAGEAGEGGAGDKRS